MFGGLTRQRVLLRKAVLRSSSLQQAQRRLKVGGCRHDTLGAAIHTLLDNVVCVVAQTLCLGQRVDEAARVDALKSLRQGLVQEIMTGLTQYEIRDILEALGVEEAKQVVRNGCHLGAALEDTLAQSVGVRLPNDSRELLYTLVIMFQPLALRGPKLIDGWGRTYNKGKVLLRAHEALGPVITDNLLGHLGRCLPHGIRQGSVLV